MALHPRRFVVWPRDNLTGRSRPASFADGVLFSDGTVVVQWSGVVRHTVVYPANGLDVIEKGAGYGGPCFIEFLDPDPYAGPPSLPLPLRDSDTGGWSAFGNGRV